MNVTTVILLKMLSFNELINYGMSEHYLAMQCEFSHDAYNYCEDLSDSVDLGRLEEMMGETWDQWRKRHKL